MFRPVGRWIGRAAMSAIAALVIAGTAQALPPPMSPEELEQKSDVVATVRVLAVACTGEVKPPGSKENVPQYQAWLQVVSATKGSVKPKQTLLVEWHDLPRPMLLGPWKVDYFAGEEVATHLKWHEKSRNYATTWWNAKGKPQRPADSDRLPTKPGELLVAKQLGDDGKKE
jgi:hypothetical protein